MINGQDIFALNYSLESTDIKIVERAAEGINILAQNGICHKSSIPLLMAVVGNDWNGFSARTAATDALHALANQGFGNLNSVSVINQFLSTINQQLSGFDPIGNIGIKKERVIVERALLSIKLLFNPDRNQGSFQPQVPAKSSDTYPTQFSVQESAVASHGSPNYQITEDEKRRLREWQEERRDNEKNQRELTNNRRIIEDALASSVGLFVPQFMDTNSTMEIVALFKNTKNLELKNLSIDFSDFNLYFTVEGRISIPLLRPGNEIKGSVRIKPKYQEGVFQVKIKIISEDIVIEMPYEIKVGGTEIY
jgi:hypothetical protein